MSNIKKPNIVIITADQWRGDCLGFLGNRHPVMTPHLNQLAAEGVYFNRAYADCPVCMPQRMTVLTGKSGSRLGITDNFLYRAPVDSKCTLPAILSRDAGYQTKAVGKMHFYPERARFGFEHITLLPDDYVNWLEKTDYAGMYRGHGLGGTEVYPAVSAVPDLYSHTRWIVDQSISFISQRDPECPFLLSVIFEAPHSPFDPPEPFDRMYDNITIPEPVYGDWVNEQDFPATFKEKIYSRKFDQLSREVICEARRKYYGQITHIDYQLGRLFGELKTKGLYDNTVIIFTSDHGEYLGDHGLFCKTSFLRGSADVPFIMRLPSTVPLKHYGLEVAMPVLTADIFPTVLELAGLKSEEEIDGISLLPVIETGQCDGHRIVFGEYSESNIQNGNAFAFATDGKYKYMYYVNGGKEQLFDTENDIDDLKNLIKNPEVAPIVQKLKNNLIEYLGKLNRPIVQNGDFITVEKELDEYTARSRNQCAWRGPMHYGQGYGSW